MLPVTAGLHAGQELALRFLTIAGLLASPQYGGNHDGIGWQLIGFEDLHAFTPPFGYYDGESNKLTAKKG
jgi:hypothetical protein